MNEHEEAKKRIQELLAAAQLMINQARDIAVLNRIDFSFGEYSGGPSYYGDLPEMQVWDSSDWYSSSQEC